MPGCWGAVLSPDVVAVPSSSRRRRRPARRCAVVVAPSSSGRRSPAHELLPASRQLLSGSSRATCRRSPAVAQPSACWQFGGFGSHSGCCWSVTTNNGRTVHCSGELENALSRKRGCRQMQAGLVRSKFPKICKKTSSWRTWASRMQPGNGWYSCLLELFCKNYNTFGLLGMSFSLTCVFHLACELLSWS